MTLLKQLIEPFNVSLHVKPSAVSKNDASITDVLLTPQGTVCIVHNNGSINTRSFDALPSEILMRILVEVVPEVKKLLSDKRQKINARVNMLEKVAREFRKLSVSMQAKPKTGQGGSRSHSSSSSSPSSTNPSSLSFSQPAGREKNSGNNEDAIKSALSDQQR